VLNFTPQITQGDTVQMTVYQETGNVISNSDPLNPVTSKRSIKTSVQVNNQDILVLGGLISTENKNNVNKVPFLGDIPGIGVLFRSKTQSVDKRNLMVFIRPTILRSEDDSVRIANGKYDFMRDQEILKQHEAVKPSSSDSETALLPSRVPSPQAVQLPVPFSS
jgi:general secretion pathway protein D